MKKKFSFGSLIFAMAMAIFVVFSFQTVSARTTVLRLVVPSPAGDYPLTYINEQLAKKFNARVKGYKIEVHAGGALAKLPEYFDAVRIGAVEMACAPWGFYTFMDSRLGLPEVPFLISNNDAGAYMAGKISPIYDKILQEKFNAKGLGIMSLGGVELVSSKPVRTLADWKGLLTGALSPMTAQMIKDLGGSPVTIMWTDMYESLQKKVIDATTGGTHAAVVMGYMDVVKNATLFFGIASWNGFSINLDIWKKMPKNVQQALQQSADEVVAEMHGIMKTLDAKDLEFFKSKNVDIYVVPEGERAKWVQATEKFRNETMKKHGALGQKILDIAAEANRRYPYHSFRVK